MAATRTRWLELEGDRSAMLKHLCRRFWEDYTETDWFLQDSAPGEESGLDLAARAFRRYFEADRDTSLESRLIGRVLAELGTAGGALTSRFDELVREKVPAEDPAWLELYVDACRARRRARLERLIGSSPRIVFTKHYTLGGSHYAYTEGLSDAQAERHFVPGAALCVLEWDGDDFREETLIDDPNGVIRDPDVSYDGRRVLFAWKKSDRTDDYHLYEMDLATREIRQLTAGLGVADYEAAYLPDGDIVFNSTRCVQIVDCWWTEVSNLYRCGGDGRFLRRLTFDQVHDNYPTVTDDGRVLYTRWEYNDRGQIYPQPLYQMAPDGTGQREFYGVNSWFPTTILHARGIPGTRKAVAVATGHHSRQTGKLIVIDPDRGRQENRGVRLVAPNRDTPAVKVDAYGQQGELFQYPYPLSEKELLVAYHPVGWPWAAGKLGPRFGVYLMTVDGRRELLAVDAKLPSSQPVPLRPRTRPKARRSAVDYRQARGTCYVENVYAGPGLVNVPRGTIKRLRVVALDFRAVGIGENRSGGPGGGALSSTPVSIGNGTWDPKIILGDAAVYEDGSALFRVPARTPIYFQLLDEKGRMVQTMRSWTTLQPGERVSCVGCHERKNSTAVARMPLSLALRSGPEDLKPFLGGSRGFSFRKIVQPVLDSWCVDCHSGSEGGAFGLMDRPVDDPDAKRRWNEAYLALTHAKPDNQRRKSRWRGDADDPMVNWVSAQSAPPMQLPYSAGSNRSELIRLLEGDHEGLRLPPKELEKIVAWIDLGVPYCGDYTEANLWSAAEIEKHDRFFAKRRRLAAEEEAGVAAWMERGERRTLDRELEP